MVVGHVAFIEPHKAPSEVLPNSFLVLESPRVGVVAAGTRASSSKREFLSMAVLRSANAIQHDRDVGYCAENRLSVRGLVASGIHEVSVTIVLQSLMQDVADYFIRKAFQTTGAARG
jgi:hypothetical protein